MLTDDLGRTSYDQKESYTNLITWVYDGGSYTPVAKLTEDDSYTIVQDYLGTPIQALDSKGEVVWDCILDIYGDVLELRGKRDFIPFRFQGQCEDQDQGLIDADSLNLNDIRRLQEEMLEHISNARKSGLNLNDYFKEGLHLRISSCK